MKLLLTFLLALTSVFAFGQANTVAAKTFNASQSIQLRANRIDSISADGKFTNGSNTVLPTQAAIKTFINPIKLRGDSIANGLFKDTTKIGWSGAGLRLGFPSALGDSLYLKNLQGGTWWAPANQSDSSIKGNVDSAAIHAYFNGFYALIGSTGGGLFKKTLNSQNVNYTIVQADTTKYITVNTAIQDTITIPDDATATMVPPVNLEVYQLGAGKIFFKALNGNVAINAKGGKTKTGGQYSKVFLNKITANNWIITGDLDTATVGFLSTNVSSLNPFTAAFGSPSSSDSFTVSGFNLTAGALVTPPANFELSLDNSTFVNSESLGLSGTSLAGQPVKIYTRVASTAPLGSVGGNIQITSTGGPSPQNVAVTGTVAGANLDSVRVNLGNSVSQTGTNVINLIGNPAVSILTGTGGLNNTITVTTVSTANWSTLGGLCSSPNNGSGGTFFSWLPNIKSEFFYQSPLGTFNLSLPQFIISGLLPGHQYTISLDFAFNAFNTSPNNTAYTQYRGYDGTTTYGPANLDGHNNVSATPVSFTFTPDGSGNFKVYMNVGTVPSGPQAGLLGDLAGCAGFIIKQIN